MEKNSKVGLCPREDIGLFLKEMSHANLKVKALDSQNGFYSFSLILPKQSFQQICRETDIFYEERRFSKQLLSSSERKEFYLGTYRHIEGAEAQVILAENKNHSINVFVSYRETEEEEKRRENLEKIMFRRYF